MNLFLFAIEFIHKLCKFALDSSSAPLAIFTSVLFDFIIGLQH